MGYDNDNTLDIIHGDIKPQNTLIFDNVFGGYTAKVADFGYSTQYTLPQDLIFMPRSWPWAAPEWHHRGFTPAQATKMDTYSFGMLVLYAGTMDVVLQHERRLGFQVHKRLQSSTWSIGPCTSSDATCVPKPASRPDQVFQRNPHKLCSYSLLGFRASTLPSSPRKVV